MRSYQTGLEYYFREIGQKLPAGSVIELRQGDAERYMGSHPGLLKPLPMTTQGRPQAVRSAAPAEVTPPVVTEQEAELEAPAVPAEVAPEPVADVVVPPAPAAAPEPVAPAVVGAPAAAEVTPDDEKAESKPKGKARAKK